VWSYPTRMSFHCLSDSEKEIKAMDEQTNFFDSLGCRTQKGTRICQSCIHDGWSQPHMFTYIFTSLVVRMIVTPWAASWWCKYEQLICFYLWENARPMFIQNILTPYPIWDNTKRPYNLMDLYFGEKTIHVQYDNVANLICQEQLRQKRIDLGLK
jgi:hypothetical protein